MKKNMDLPTLADARKQWRGVKTDWEEEKKPEIVFK